MGSNGFLLLSPATVLIIFSRLGKRFWSTLFGEELKGQFTWIEKGTWSGQLVSSYAHSFWTMCQDTEIWALNQWEKLLNSKSQITLLKLTLSFFFLKKWEENSLREWSSSTRPKSASQFWTKWSGLPFIKWKELNKNFSTSGEIQQQHLFPHRMTVFMQTMFWVRTFDGICAILLLDWLSKNDVKATEPNLI